MKHHLKITTFLVSAFLISPAAHAGFEFVPSQGPSQQYQKAPRIEPLQPPVKNRIPVITAPRQQSFVNRTPMDIQQPQYQDMQVQQPAQMRPNPNPPLASMAKYPEVRDIPMQGQQQAQPQQFQQSQQQAMPQNLGIQQRQVMRPQPIVDQNQQQSQQAMQQMMRQPQQMPRQNMGQGEQAQRQGVFAQGLPQQQMAPQQMAGSTPPAQQPFPDYVPSVDEVQSNLSNEQGQAGQSPDSQQMAANVVPQNNYVATPSMRPIETGTIPVYSDVGVYGEAYDNTIRRAPRERRNTLFSINPFPFGNKELRAENQQGLLFGRPVSATNDMPLPVVAAGPYTNNYQPVGSLNNADKQMRNTNAPTQITSRPVREVYNPTEPVNYNPQTQGTMANSSIMYDDVVGFGNDIPLPIALSQVVPDNYSFSYDEQVNLSQSVSWEGGKPWNQVLTEMLKPHSLKPVISDSSVRIISNAQQSALHIDKEPMALETIKQSAQSALMFKDDLADKENALQTAVNYDTTIRLWTAPANATLQRVIETWANEADVQLHWTAEYDYPLQSAVNIRGTFVEAIEMLLDGLRDAQPRPVARLHPNLPDGPPVLVLETRHIIR